MSSDEAEKKVDETQDTTASSADEKEENCKEDKVNNKPAAKKKGADQPKIKQPAKKRVKTEHVEKESKKEDKKKKIKEEESEEEGSAEENDVENHKAVPLLDQPLELSGSRKRKEVQRFIPVAPADAESKELKIPQGKGQALGIIPSIESNIQRAKPEDLKILHRLCFGKPGKSASWKKSIKLFNGFEYEEASDDYEKKKNLTEKSFKKVTISHLKNICNILDLEKNGTKDEILDRILSFLTKPVDSGKKPRGAGRSKRKVATPKNYDEGEEKFEKGKKKAAKGKKKEEVSEESDKEDGTEEEEDEDKKVKGNIKKKEDAQTTEESAPEEEEEKPKKVAKKAKKAPEAAEKKAPPKKRATAKKAVEKKSDSEGAGDEDSEEEEEPLSKKAKAPPTDEEIKTYVKSLLEGANLELITMKKVCQDVYAHYPDFDLGHKKDFIKTTVKSLISS